MPLQLAELARLLTWHQRHLTALQTAAAWQTGSYTIESAGKHTSLSIQIAFICFLLHGKLEPVQFDLHAGIQALSREFLSAGKPQAFSNKVALIASCSSTKTTCAGCIHQLMVTAQVAGVAFLSQPLICDLASNLQFSL